jgi:MFS family permease
MAEQYHWSRSVISAGMSVMVLAYGIGGIFAGRLADRIAPRWIITAGAVLMATGLFLTALVSEPWHFYVTYGIFGGLGAACLGVVVCNSSVGKWFVRKRGLAIGIASIGVGAGTMATVPLAGYVVKFYGWQMGFTVIWVFVLIIGVGLSQWLMGRNRRLWPAAGRGEPQGRCPRRPAAFAFLPLRVNYQEFPVLDHGGLLQPCRDSRDVEAK